MRQHLSKPAALSLAIAGLTCAGAAQAQQNDPLYRYQWHLMNYGQQVLGDTRPSFGIDMGIDDLHDYNIRGKGVVVGVLDDGLEIDHPDLVANVIPNGSKNFFVTTARGEHDTGPNELGVDGHGTSVSGIIGAVGWNGIGVRGVAPEVKLRGFNFLVSTFIDVLGYRLPTKNQQATDANIRYAWWDGAESKDVQVSNNSWGGMNPWPEAFSENAIAGFERPMTATRNGLGTIYVKAAGNDFASVNKDEAKCNAETKLRNVGCMQAFLDPRNNLFNVMTIAAVNAAGRRASYSTPGAALWVSGLGGEYGGERQTLLDAGYSADGIDAVGPRLVGPAIVTTDLAGCALGMNTNTPPAINRLDTSRSAIDATCNYTGLMNGTSAATPTVTGVVALMLQANPKLTYRDVKYILATTARRIDPDQPAATAADGTTVLVPGWTRNAAGYYFSNWYGYGLVDATAAVTRANNFKSLTPLVDSGWQRSAAQAQPAAIGGAATPARLSIPINGIRNVESVQIGLVTDYTVSAPPVGQTTSPLPLSVTLVSPQGTRSVVVPASMAVSSGGAAFSLDLAASNAFLDENGTGTWTLEVADVPLAAGAASAGNLTSFKLRVLGR